MKELEIITHIHTEASSGQASKLDHLVTEAIKSVLGPEYESRWKECFNTPQDVCRSLKPDGPVSMVFMTDHMNEKYHRHNPDALSLAFKDSRIAVGAEIQTWTRDENGNVISAPEVLIYGREQQALADGKIFHGVSEEDLSILFKECSIDDSGRADITLVRDFCILNGYAHALAHPFDGSELDLDQLLDVITEFKFVETVNGGFPADSSRRLSQFVSWYNKAADCLIEEAPIQSQLLRRMYLKALENGPVHPWGGSDAHALNHDRVVVLYRTEKENPTPKDFFADMVGRDVWDLAADRVFYISGAPATPITLLDDVSRICYLNVASHMDLIKDTSKLLELIAKIRAVTAAEIKQRRRRKKLLIRDFDESVGEEIRLGLSQARRQQWKRNRTRDLDPSDLPERIP